MPMSPSLHEFLDKVWAHRADPHLDIYQLYSGRAHGMPDTGPSEHAGYGSDLFKLAELLPAPVVQPGTADLAELMSMDWGGAAPDEVAKLSFWLERSKAFPALLGPLLVSFMHFTKENRDASAWRVYLNIFPVYTVAVARFVVNEVLNNIPGLGNAKVLGPLAAGRDRVVIYAADKSSALQAVDRLKRFYAGCSSMFRRDSVAMTQRIDGVRGISIGEEPPAVRYRPGTGDWLPRGSSFGAFREDLIHLALSLGRPGSTKASFLITVEKLFRRFGIDPMKPHEHTDRAYAARVGELCYGRLEKESELQELRAARQVPWPDDSDLLSKPPTAPVGRPRSASI